MIAGWWFRFFGVLTIVNVLLITVPITLAPIPPFGINADLLPFNTQYGGAMMVGNYLATWQLLTNLFLLTFLVAVIRQVEARSGGWLWMLVQAGAFGFIAIATVTALFFDMGPFLTHLGNNTLLLMPQLALFGIQLADAFQILLMGAIAAATLQLRFLPAWLGWLAAGGAVLSLVGTFGLLVTEGPVSVRGAITLFVGGPIQQVWLLVLGIYWLFARQPIAAERADDGDFPRRWVFCKISETST